MFTSLKKITVFLLITLCLNVQAKCIGPKYNFVFETGSRYGEIYTVRNGYFEKAYVPPPEEIFLSKTNFYPAELFVYNVQSHTINKTSFEQLKNLNIFVNMNPFQGTSVSPDGYTVIDYGFSGHGLSSYATLGFYTLKGIDPNYFYIEGHGCRIKTILPKNSSEYYLPNILAWIIVAK